jgi:uncharacterized protein (TIGR03435 family)
VGLSSRSFWLAVLVVSASAAVFPAAGAQADRARLTFEVAAIRENRSGRVESFAYPYASAGRLVLVNHTARQMIRQAYDLREYQVSGGPGWLDRVRYDIEAKAAGPVTRAQLMRMLQSLLEDKFRLVARHEVREEGVLMLRLTTPGSASPRLIAATPQDARLNPVGAQPDGLRGSAATMADLAAVLSNLQGRLVIDQTGLTGMYNFAVTFAAERRLPPGVPADALPPQRQDLPALPTALREQLGLQLEASRGPVPTLVVESAQQPDVDGYSSTAAPVQSDPPSK